MAKGITDFVKENARQGVKDMSHGTVGKIFGAAAILELATAENKLKAIGKLILNIVAFKPILAGMFVGAFGSASKGMKNMVRDSGAVDAALKKMGKSIKEVGDAYEEVSDKMKEKIGMPWAQDDIQNTKNMTDAVRAMTPAVEEASGVWNKLSGGFSTTKSWMAKTAAESGVLGFAIRGLSTTLAVILPIISVLSASALVGWFSKLAGAITTTAAGAGRFGSFIARWSGGLIGAAAATGLATKAMRLLAFAARAIPWVLVATGIMKLAGAAYNFINSGQKAAEEMDRMTESSNRAAAAVQSEISAINSVESAHEALSSALKHSDAMYKQWLDTIASGKGSIAESVALVARWNAEAMVGKAKVAASPVLGAGMALGKAEAAKASRLTAESLALQNATPEGRVALLRRIGAESSAKANAGMKEARGYANASEKLAPIDLEIQQRRMEADRSRQMEIAKQKEIVSLGGSGVSAANARIREMEAEPARQAEVGDLEGKKQYVAMRSGSNEIKAQVEIGRLMKIRDASNQTEIDALIVIQKLNEHNARILREEAIAMEEKATRSMDEANILERSNKLAEDRAGIEGKLAQSKNIGNQRADEESQTQLDLIEAQREAQFNRPGGPEAEAMRQLNIQQDQVEQARTLRKESQAAADLDLNMDARMQRARLSGNPNTTQRLANEKTGMDRYQAALGAGMSREDAQDEASRFMADSISLKARDQFISAQGSATVTSMQRLGLGGGISEGGGGMYDVAKQQLDAQEDMRDYLQTIANRSTGLTIKAN